MVFGDLAFPVLRRWVVIIPLVIWEAVWKGIALWKAGKNAHLAWFICLFIFNTLGILPIIYIFGFSKKKE